MKYKKTFPFETVADVWFKDGKCVRVECQIGLFSRLNWIRLGNENIQVNEFNMKKHKIERIEFMTPSTLYV